jgi:hypothetical protein
LTINFGAFGGFWWKIGGFWWRFGGSSVDFGGDLVEGGKNMKLIWLLEFFLFNTLV